MRMIEINSGYCKGCLICVEFCPKGVLSPSAQTTAKGYILPEVIDPDACIECGLCEIVCPDFAIAVLKTKRAGQAGRQEELQAETQSRSNSAR